MAGSGHRFEQPESAAVRQLLVDGATAGGDGGIREALADRGGGLGVIGMLVRQRNSCQSSSTFEHLHQRRHVLSERGPRIDQPGRLASDDPGVRSRERERACI